MGLLTKVINMFSGNEQFLVKEKKRAAVMADLSETYSVESLVEYLTSYPDPDLILQKLGIPREHLRKLMFDDEIYAAWETREDYSVHKSDAWIGADEKENDLCREVLGHFTLGVKRGAFSANQYGYSVQEIVWVERKDGIIIPKSVQLKPFEWFKMLPDGRVYLNLTEYADYIDQEFKFIVTRHKDEHRNPHGEAVLSRLWWPWFFKSKGWKMWAQYMERSSTPILIGKSDDPDEMMLKLKKMVQDAYIAVDLDHEVAALNSSNASADFTKYDEALSRRIQKVVFGQTGTTDIRQGSGFAASRVMERVLENKILSDIRLEEDAVQKLTNAFWILNRVYGRGRQFNKPIPKYEIENDDDLQLARAERDSKLMAGGVVFRKEYFARRYDYRPEDIERIISPKEQGSPEKIEDDGRQTPDTGKKYSLEDSAKNMRRLEDLTATLRGMNVPVEFRVVSEALRASGSFEDFVQRVCDVMPDALQPQVAEAMFEMDASSWRF